MIEAFVAQYGKVTVRFDGVEEPVVVAEVARAEAWLGLARSNRKPPAPGIGSPGKEWASPTVGIMKWIPTGTFTMGSPETEANRQANETPHPVTITRGYWLMEHEVTQTEWVALMGGGNPSRVFASGGSLPVEQVTWQDAVDFAARASLRDGVRYRLPTEAEWEFAARGGKNYIYAGNSSADKVAWYIGNSRYPSAVCGKARNGYGLCDMSGNVAEWVADVFDTSQRSAPGGILAPYAAAAVSDPVASSSRTDPGTFRGVRGGGFDYVAQDVRVAARSVIEPDSRSASVGFRLARPAPWLDDAAMQQGWGAPTGGVTPPLVAGSDWASPTMGSLKWVPAGSFVMGAQVGAGTMDSAMHKVTLTKGYWVMENEVTQAEWQTVMGSNPSAYETCGADCPVDSVSWVDAVEFTKRASTRDGVAYRLPTEAEWQYAARGGQAFTYAGSNAVDDVAWASGATGPHPVCQKARNGYGLCDMSGNVQEWVSDWYAEYPSTAVTDPQGPSSSESGERVNRGGCWGCASNARINNGAINHRSFDKPTYLHDRMGLRLTVSPP